MEGSKIKGIYTITNIINNKIYIGYSKDIIRRKNNHFSKLRRNIHGNIILQNSYNKYGESNFKFELLEECEEEFLASQENYWCNILQTYNKKYGYNIQITNPNKQWKLSIETKNKISKSNKNKKKSKEHIEKLRFNFKGKKHTIEAKNKVSEARKGKKFSEEHKEKLRIAKLGNKNRLGGNKWKT